MKKLLIIIAALVISNSCQKDDYLEFYDLKYECTKSMKFSCEGITSDQYFKGIINGKEFCVSHGNKYKDLTGFYTGGTTTSPFEFDPSEFGRVGLVFKFEPEVNQNPTTICDGVDMSSVPSINLWSPYVIDSTIPPMKQLMDEFISIGEKKFWTKDDSNGFRFFINWTCGDTTYYEGFDRRTDCIQGGFGTGGKKLNPQKNRIVISDLHITETPDFYIYDITFEINAELFSTDKYRNTYHYGQLEDGIFKHRAFVEK
ncbi:MAG: hypothetical protein Kow0027_27020 [Saprospiraceae bacterium]|jgi:hypothetical protein|nr:hypothetical protein [Saprospirales bacterium]